MSSSVMNSGHLKMCINNSYFVVIINVLETSQDLMAIGINKIFMALSVGFSNIGANFVVCNSANGIKEK